MLGNDLEGWVRWGRRVGREAPGDAKTTLESNYILIKNKRKSSAANQSKGLVVHKTMWMDFRNKILKVKTKRKNEVFTI